MTQQPKETIFHGFFIRSAAAMLDVRWQGLHAHSCVNKDQRNTLPPHTAKKENVFKHVFSCDKMIFSFVVSVEVA